MTSVAKSHKRAGEAKRRSKSEDKPLLAYSVLEEQEHTGGIVFAKSAISARRQGANIYADGEFAEVTCRRAPYADQFADNGIVPASELIANGWHFECGNCSARLDEDGLYDRDLEIEDVVGNQHSVVYCHDLCEAQDRLQIAKRKYIERRWIKRLTRLVKARFPEAEILSTGNFNKPTVNLTWHNERHVIQHAFIPFSLPCLTHGNATLAVEKPSYGKDQRRKIFYSCTVGDKDAFEEYARLNRSPRSKDREKAA